MADYSPYAPGYMAARSVWDQGIAPLAEKVQGFLKGTAGLPSAVKDYAVEAGQSESGLTTQLGVDAFKLLHAMREGIKEDPLRAIAEMYPPVGAASDLFETNQLLDMAQNAEEAGDLEKAQTLRELANTIVLMGIIPGGPPAKRTIDQKLKEMAEKRRKLKEETGLPYVPNKDAPLPEGRRIDVNEPELDVLERQRRLEQATTGSVKMLDEAVVNQPIDRIPFVHNAEPNPALQNIRKQELYGTHIEPAGQYVSPVSESYLAELSTNNPAHLLTGVKTFENPLVIKFGGSYDAPDNWKQVLHQRYGNKAGMDLNEAIRSDGYDGIVTVDENGNLSEIVDLAVGKGNVDLKAAGGIVTL